MSRLKLRSAYKLWNRVFYWTCSEHMEAVQACKKFGWALPVEVAE